MSGFGSFGSFGNNNNINNNNPFGAAPQAAAPGGSFPFGAAPSMTPAGGGITFGDSSNLMSTQPPAPAHQQQQQPFGSGFGANTIPMGGQSAPPIPFGSSGFSSPPTTAVAPNPFGASGSMTSFASPPASSTFGALSSPPPFGQAPPHQQPPMVVNPFGQSAGSTMATNTPVVFGDPFGTSMTTAAPAGPPAMTPFGSSTAMNASFSNNDSHNNPMSSPFANSNSMASSSNNMTQNMAPNPFGGGGSAPAVTFGTSSNLLDTDMSGGGTTTPPLGFTSPPPAPSRSSLPFGSPAMDQSQTTNTWPPPPLLKSQGLILPGSQQPSDESAKADKLKARLEAKKKKLEELKRRKQQEAIDRNRGTGTTVRNNPPPPAKLSASAAPFVSSALVATTDASASLADRNAARFDSSATNAATRDHLPADLRAKVGAGIDYAALRSGTTGREALDQAVSLTGTCPYMCPDEELLRRELEGDIQMLELVLPGDLHPKDWTLRNTAIKRFRRSAADYKLDVPEWIRPPDVLERVCSYLEEWVMERDRQGPDPRFPKGGMPPPLDVYQFIWDRTRMIRKDFILQNYVGTGGMCDARAVRCHERIARWHTMCEHQLAHIHDFVVAQSQQNIQELGQTMKTLNQYYDDSMNRSRIEVPDEHGNETRTDLTSYAHGCLGNVVQGKVPTEFEGGELDNTYQPARRLVGMVGVQQYHHGTAEPEMRGLYILLTIDNDGGMEVMRYAAHLSRTRPEVFQSFPVQLALKIYKAKKELNYAKFFQILRDPSTPYLFACIMFKHTEFMRRTAMKIMSKTFGGKNRETNEALYDMYQLKDLIRTLCFEDAEEALNACKHYNITVKETKVKSSTSGTRMEHIIFWRNTDFSEPKDPDKGTGIPLRPRKMVSAIERKRRGASRLAVCRGDVSGDGCSLIPNAAQSAVQGMSFEELAKRQTAALEAMKEEEDAKLHRAEVQRRAAIRQDEQRRRQEEQQQLEADKLQFEKETQEQERIKREELEAEERRKREEDISRKRAEEEERQLKLQAEREERERIKLEQERLRKLEEERVRREKEQVEVERLRRLEQERQEIERRKAEEERRRQEAARERQIREEQERQRELARIQEAKRRAKEEEERRITKEWNEKINKARRLLTLRRWKRKLPRYLEMYEESRTSLLQLKNPSESSEALQAILKESSARSTALMTVTIKKDLRSVLDGLLKHILRPVSFDCLRSLGDVQQQALLGGNHVFLMKIAVLLPESSDSRHFKLSSLALDFAAKRLRFGRPSTVPVDKGEVRLVFVDGNNPENRDACDGVLIVLPSSRSGIPSDAIESISSTLDSIPRATVLLTETMDSDDECGLIHGALNGDKDDMPLTRNTVLSEEAVDNALISSVESLLFEVTKRPVPVIERIPLDRLAMLCLNEVIWLDGLVEHRDGLQEAAKDALAVLVDELEIFGRMGNSQWIWPSHEFSSSASVIPSYFAPGVDLPTIWPQSLLRENVEPSMRELACRLSGSMPHVISSMLWQAPDEVRNECRTLLDQRLFRRCLQRTLLWRHKNPEPWQATQYVYLPQSMVRRVIERTVEAVRPPLPTTNLTGLASLRAYQERTEKFPDAALVETMGAPPAPVAPPPPVETPPDEPPRTTSPPRRKRRTSSGGGDSSSSGRPRSSKRVRESRAFTRRLEALAAGGRVGSVVHRVEDIL